MSATSATFGKGEVCGEYTFERYLRVKNGKQFVLPAQDTNPVKWFFIFQKQVIVFMLYTIVFFVIAIASLVFTMRRLKLWIKSSSGFSSLEVLR